MRPSDSSKIFNVALRRKSLPTSVLGNVAHGGRNDKHCSLMTVRGKCFWGPGKVLEFFVTKRVGSLTVLKVF